MPASGDDGRPSLERAMLAFVEDAGWFAVASMKCGSDYLSQISIIILSLSILFLFFSFLFFFFVLTMLMYAMSWIHAWFLMSRFIISISVGLLLSLLFHVFIFSLPFFTCLFMESLLSMVSLVYLIPHWLVYFITILCLLWSCAFAIVHVLVHLYSTLYQIGSYIDTSYVFLEPRVIKWLYCTLNPAKPLINLPGAFISKLPAASLFLCRAPCGTSYNAVLSKLPCCCQLPGLAGTSLFSIHLEDWQS